VLVGIVEGIRIDKDRVRTVRNLIMFVGLLSLLD